jgi:alanyl-tRNA synthetase
MRAHTATHLLHAELAQFFPDTKQAWSLVDSDFLRFDFYADRLLTQEELAIIEKRVNQIIYMACEVKIEEMKIEDAWKLGAKMFFEEKYWDIVRVVQVFNKELPEEMKLDGNEEYFSSRWEKLSIELCWWTHVSNTKDIGAFTIISQEAVASWIKRLTALTWPRVIEKINDYSWLLSNLMNLLEVKSYSQLPEKAQKLLKDYWELKSQVESLETKAINSFLESWEKKSNWDFDIIMKVPVDMNFKVLWNQAKAVFVDKNILLATENWNFMLFTKNWNPAKALAQKLWLKWWGNDQQIQGRDPNVVGLL